MSETEDAPALLKTALQDLRAGEQMLADRLPPLIDAVAEEALREALHRQRERAAQQAEALAADERSLDGPDNLWMQGIIDDARRDADTVAAGPLRDTALIGAVRKALATKHVSYETAVALAERLSEAPLAATLRRCRDEEVASDHRLAALLEACAGEAA